MRRFDFVVVGLGLGGAAVCWHSRWAGRAVLAVDRGGPSASRAAAGLVTPVTGGRLAPSWRVDDLWPAAAAFYRRVEADTGTAVLAVGPAVRLFADAAERTDFAARADRLGRWVGPLDPPPDPAFLPAPFGGFAMPGAGRVDVAGYLAATRASLAAAGGFVEADLDPAADVEVTADGVRLPALGVAAGGVVFCRGFAAAGDPWFPHVAVRPTKGEVLTVRIPGLAERRVVHAGGLWLAPAGDGLYRVGATYHRDEPDPHPTAAGRAELVDRLSRVLTAGADVVDHRAGVRPVVRAGRPVVGSHPTHGCRIGYLNGLGSKGGLLAPYFAGQLVAHLTAGRPIDPEVDVRRHRG